MFNITVEDLQGKSRKAEIVKARQFIIWAYDHLGFSYEEIAVFLRCPERAVWTRMQSLRNNLKYDKGFKLVFRDFQSRVKIF
jgi:hypothetical protein